MEKINFVINWAREEKELTTYWGYPKVDQWVRKFYSGKDEKTAIANLRYYFDKLKGQGVLLEAHCVGLGFDAKIDFFGTTKQFFWQVNKKRLERLYGG